MNLGVFYHVYSERYVFSGTLIEEGLKNTIEKLETSYYIFHTTKGETLMVDPLEITVFDTKEELLNYIDSKL